MRFSINTLGCKVNLCESDEIWGLLSDRGFHRIDFRDGEPDLCIVNTCTVTSESDRKVRQLVRKIRRVQSGAVLAVIGCYVKNNHDFLIQAGADIILENDCKQDMQGLVDEIIKKVKRQVGPGPLTCPVSAIRNGHSRPIIKVQDGCEQDCAYCIIPAVRGRYRSREAAVILEKVKGLVDEGFEEVVLTGIHIGKYGIGAGANGKLASLLEKIFSETGIKRVRISSLEINEVSSRLLQVMEKYRQRTAPHLHIPLQSGSDAVLENMGRPYDVRYFESKIQEILDRLPGTAITTDVMVGFPGETEKDFQDTCKTVKKIGFSKLHVFKYSPRPGTRAFYFDGAVHEDIKNKRSAFLRELGGKIRQGFIEDNAGRCLKVAVEQADNGGTVLSGTSGNYIKVYFESGSDFRDIRGRLIDIKAEKRFRNGLWGKEGCKIPAI